MMVQRWARPLLASLDDDTRARLAVSTTLVIGPDGHGLHPAAELVVRGDPNGLELLDGVFGAALVAGEAVPADEGARRKLLHDVAARLLPGGLLVVESGFDDLLPLARACGFEAASGWFRRTNRRTVHDLVNDARAKLQRVTPAQLAAALRSADPPLVLDSRSGVDRERRGAIAGSLHTPRSVIEWMADPASGYSHPAISSLDQRLVVVCNGGFSSSLAAASLQDLGFTGATDLIGGVNAWVAAGFPVVAPDHTRVE